MAQHVVSGAAGVIGGDTNIDVAAALSSMQAGLDAMEIPELLLLVMETSLVSLVHENHVGADHGYPVRQNDRDLPRVQKRRLSSAGGVRTFWESGFGKPVKKSIKDAEKVSL